MNVLVTGANGQLGMCLRDRAKGNFVFSDVVDIPAVETIHLDITDLEAIRAIVREHQIDAIVNCAAWTNVDGAEDPERFDLVEKLNATAPENLAKAMKEVIATAKDTTRAAAAATTRTNWSCPPRTTPAA